MCVRHGDDVASLENWRGIRFIQIHKKTSGLPVMYRLLVELWKDPEPMIIGGRDEAESRMMRGMRNGKGWALRQRKRELVRRCASANGNIRRCASANGSIRRRASASGNSARATASFLSPVARHRFMLVSEGPLPYPRSRSESI